jgi:hypothetical protein
LGHDEKTNNCTGIKGNWKIFGDFEVCPFQEWTLVQENRKSKSLKRENNYSIQAI